MDYGFSIPPHPAADPLGKLFDLFGFLNVAKREDVLLAFLQTHFQGLGQVDQILRILQVSLVVVLQDFFGLQLSIRQAGGRLLASGSVGRIWRKLG